ncbi:MAG: hypothetical protein FWE10_06750 [Rikenellaceae bacterium]|nr:hypothetical protein [Rikenellaceae bacterium]MCL2692516.1 hypothetical protein [Rikenellaceae bacterium]
MKTIKNISRLSDDTLVKIWHETGLEEAAETLFRRYMPFIHGVFLHQTRDDKVAHEAVVRFHKQFSGALSHYHGDNLAEWIYSKLGGKTEASPANCWFTEYYSREKDAAIAYIETESDKLSKPQRECLRLFFRERKTFAQISEQTGYLNDDVYPHIDAGIAAIAPPVTVEKTYDRNFSAAKFSTAYIDYVHGERTNAAAYELEFASLTSPFLADAINGALSVRQEYSSGYSILRRRPISTKWWVIISILIAIAVGLWAYFQFCRNDAVSKDGVPKNVEAHVPYESAEYEGLPVKEILLPEESNSVSSEPPDRNGVPDEMQEIRIGSTEQPVRLLSISKAVNAAGDAEPHYISIPQIGVRQYNEYLKTATVWPLEDAEVAGDVTLVFYVNRYGRPSRIRVLGFLSPEAHREAIRLLDKGPEWSPSNGEVTIIMRFGD